MNLDRVGSGSDIPNDFNVIIEIPMNSDPIKYEVDKTTGAMFVDRFMSTCMHYPCNYGYIPHTLSDDGDPVDVLVISPVPLITGVVVRCRPLGVLRMCDEAGEDAKLLAVPITKLCNLYEKSTRAKIYLNWYVPKSLIFSRIIRTWKRANGLKSKAGTVWNLQS